MKKYDPKYPLFIHRPSLASKSSINSLIEGNSLKSGPKNGAFRVHFYIYVVLCYDARKVYGHDQRAVHVRLSKFYPDKISIK